MLHWKTIGIEAGGSSRPVMIKSIQISGKFVCLFIFNGKILSLSLKKKHWNLDFRIFHVELQIKVNT